MIIDRLANQAQLFQLPARLARALEYLRATDLTSVAIGRHDLDGDRLFALVQDTRPARLTSASGRRTARDIDVQFVAVGVERMGYANLAQMRERDAYDATRDVAFFDPGESFVTIPAGTFAIFGPEDVHSPGHSAGAACLVRKVVVKAMLNAEC